MEKKTIREKRTYILIKTEKSLTEKELYFKLKKELKINFGKLIYSEMNFKTIKPWKRKYKGKQKHYSNIKKEMKENNLHLISCKRDFEKMLRFILPSFNISKNKKNNLKTIKTSHNIQPIRKYINEIS